MPVDFETQRARLWALAYRMLGSASDADDIVQDCWIRFTQANAAPDGPAWLTSVATRLCLDKLKHLRVAREKYPGPWLPEPTSGFDASAGLESISTAFLLVLEQLSPTERAAYLLRHVFDYSHREIADILNCNEQLVRQWTVRAKAHLASERPRFAANSEQHQDLLLSFLTACQTGDLTRVRQLLADDAKAHTDGGGKARAAMNVVCGAEAVARLFVGLAQKGPVNGTPELVLLNGWPHLVMWQGDRPEFTFGIETDGQRIFAVHVVRNPDKLQRLQKPA